MVLLWFCAFKEARKMKNIVLYGLTIVTFVFCVEESRGESLSGHPTSWIPTGMLESLDPNTQANLEPIVEVAFEAVGRLS
jgi:hypothetical protein